MDSARGLSIAIWLLLALTISISGRVQVDEKKAANETLFEQGQFAAAETASRATLAREPGNFTAALLLGRIALLSNRLDEAEKWLTAATKLRPENKAAIGFLAEVFYRRDQFDRAAPLLRAQGKDAMARQLESFKGMVPYEVAGSAKAARVKFINIDPLPLVAVSINHGEEVNFLIDTGGSEVIVDSDFAEKAGIARFGEDMRTFGGGNRAAIAFGHVASLALGGVEVKNVPVHLLSTQRFSAATRGKPVSGVIGTVFLYHFLPILDYTGGQLVLEPRTRGSLTELERRAQLEKQVVIPFWMAGDHFMVSWGRVSKSGPVLLFVDTGLAGGAYTGPRSVLDEAGIKLIEEKVGEGIGGAGPMKIVPFEIDELALGGAKERGLSGVFGPFPASLEYGQGFRIGGIISHQFFRHYAVTFDFTGMRFFLKREPEGGHGSD